MDKLIKLHDEVKNHPYRINEDKRYFDSYCDLLGDLSHEFYMVIKETKYKNATNMIHDFNNSTYYLSNNMSDLPNHILHIERCISTIHEFIISGKVTSYWTFYTGCNTNGLPRIKKYILNEKENRYYMDSTEEEFDTALAFLENEYKDKEKPERYFYYKVWLTENKEYSMRKRK